jgi:Mg2+ and Co2+ transporter CorA
MQHYHDVLLKEMNARKPFNCLIRPLADLFIPVTPALMKGTLEPTRESRKNRRDSQRHAEQAFEEVAAALAELSESLGTESAIEAPRKLLVAAETS